MSSLPFIIKTNIIEPTVPKDSEVFDPAQQTKIQILQAINGYFTINMTIESCKIFWSFWHFQTECPLFSYLSIGFMALNILWAVFSYFGFRSIRLKNARHIRIFSYLIILNLLLRSGMYAICGVVMKGMLPRYGTITPQEVNNMICTALYPQTLYIITGVFQGLISLLILFLIRSVVIYIQAWESSQTERMIPLKKIENNQFY